MTVSWKVAFATAEDGFACFAIALFIISDEVFPVPVLLIGYDFGEFINLEFLILWRMGIIKRPLLKWDVSTDKV